MLRLPVIRWAAEVPIRCWIEHARGARLRVQARGSVVGRGVDCDLILGDATASRHHVLVRLAQDRLELVPLGKNATSVNGVLCIGPVNLQDGDVVAIPGASFRIRIEGSAPESVAQWALHSEDLGTVPIAAGGLEIGGGDGDGIRLADQPDTALRIGLRDGAPFAVAEARVGLNGDPLPRGTEHVLAPSDQLVLGSWQFEVRRLAEPLLDETQTLPEKALPVEVRLVFAHRGGHLQVVFQGARHDVALSERRTDFVAVLLKPPKGYQPGEFVPDAVLFPRVWGATGGNRNGVNVLVSRLRSDLSAVGLVGTQLIERYRGGSATRFLLHPKARVEVR